VHIPKTAGGTVDSILTGAFSKTAVGNAGNHLRNPERGVRKISRISDRPGSWETWERTGGRVLTGHAPYSAFLDAVPANARYVTFVRNPIDRVLSHYYRHFHRHRSRPARRVKEQRGGAKVKTESLEQAMVEMRLPQMRNLATRFLCTHQSPDTELSPAALDEAKANLRKFAFVGIQERFEESAVMLQRALGIWCVPYLTRHIGSRRPTPRDISDAERALIEEHNQLDLELYAFSLELFEQAVEARGHSLAEDLEELRSACAAAEEQSRAEHRWLCEWLDRELPPGSTRPLAEIRKAVEEAGISAREFKRVRLLTGTRKVRPDGGGPCVWIRPAENAPSG
jgi:hypothetical protein